VRYLIYFRRRKGGCGIPYRTARAEFDALFEGLVRDIPEESWVRGWLLAEIDLPPEEMARRAELAGYIEAVLLTRDEPYRGEELKAAKRRRWFVGWVRRGELKRFQEELYVQDDEERLALSPHMRTMKVEVEGRIVEARGYRHHRGLSPLDAKFLLNLARLKGDELILDPFAGFGSIVLEARRRGIDVVASDIDPSLRIGLWEVSGGRALVCDARRLPFKSGAFDAIVTEPPYGREFREAVYESVRELVRVVKEGAPIVVLAIDEMRDGLVSEMEKLGFKLREDHLVRRHEGMKCRALRFQAD